MNKRLASMIMLACCLSVAYSEPHYHQDSGAGSMATADSVNSLFNTNVDASLAEGDGAQNGLDKRVERYAFGLGRRAYTYTNGGNGMKRLPVYNFGLGKRAVPYSFGLGKRYDYDDYEPMVDNAHMLAVQEILSGRNGNDDKRNRPYSFGLGKRAAVDSNQGRYGFGLGRR